VAALRRRKPPGRRPSVTGVRAADLAAAIPAEDVGRDRGRALPPGSGPRSAAAAVRRSRTAGSDGWLSRQLRQRGLPGADRTFADVDDLGRAIHAAVDRLNHDRRPHPSASFVKAA